MEFVIGFTVGTFVIVCFAVTVWVDHRRQKLADELAEVRLDERFDSVYRLFDDRCANLDREQTAAREELQREFQKNLEGADRYNEDEHERLRLRLEKLELNQSSKK